MFIKQQLIEDINTRQIDVSSFCNYHYIFLKQSEFLSYCFNNLDKFELEIEKQLITTISKNLFLDKKNEENSWFFNLNAVNFSQLSFLHLYHNDEENYQFKLFQKITSLQAFSYMIINGNIDFSFPQKKALLFLETTKKIFQENKFNEIQQTIKKITKFQNILSKIFNKKEKNIDMNIQLNHYLNDISELSSLIKQYKDKNKIITTSRNSLKSFFPTKNTDKLINNSLEYIRHYNKFFLSNYSEDLINNTKNLLIAIDYEKNYSLILPFFLKLTHSIINKDNFEIYHHFLNHLSLNLGLNRLSIDENSENYKFFYDFYSYSNFHTISDSIITKYLNDEYGQHEIDKKFDEQYQLMDKLFTTSSFNQFIPKQQIFAHFRANKLTDILNDIENKSQNYINNKNKI